MLSALQRDLIFPGHRTQGKRDAEFRTPPGAERLDLRSDRGERITALFGAALGSDGSPTPNPSAAPSLVFFYGNGMHLAQSLDLFDEFRRLGANVLIPEYLGYGLSEGVAGEAGCLATARAAFDHLAARTDLDPRRLIASGWSLGAASALHLGATRDDVAGVAIFSAFASLAGMVRLHFPMIPPALLEHKFDNEAAIARVARPIFLGHGALDDLIPIADADRLAQAAEGPVTRLTIPNAGHNDFFWVGRREIARTFKAWLLQFP